jgi:hypothetical protein
MDKDNSKRPKKPKVPDWVLPSDYRLDDGDEDY